MTEAFPLTPIPFELMIAGRTVGGPYLSPLGDTIVFPAAWGPQVGLFRVDPMGGPERLISAEVSPAIGRGAFGGLVDWASDGAWLVFVGADGNIYRLPSSGGVPTLAVDTGEGRSVANVTLSPDNAWICGVVDFAEIWLWPAATDGRSAVRVDAGRDEFVNDPSFSPDGEQLVWQAWNPPDMAWDGAVAVMTSVADALASGGSADAGSGEASGQEVPPRLIEMRAWGAIQQPRLLTGGRLIGLRDDDGWLNLWIDDEPLVSEPHEHGLPTWGSGQASYAIAPDEQRIAYWRNEGGFGSLHIVDTVTRRSEQIDRGIFTHLNWSGDTLAALRSGARTPPEIVTYVTARADARPSRRRVAYSAVAGWGAFELPEPEVVEVAASDEVMLYARHYELPAGAVHRGMIVWVHGGPTDQTLVDWNPRIGYWWSRGYSSLVVDPRGSTGHGRAYQRAMNGRWGAVDVDDTATLISYAHVRGWATPETTVISGSSAGGLTVLGVVGRYPELVCGGIARYPVTNLETLAAGTHRFEAHYPLTLVGDLDDTEHYRRLSATSYAADVERPLLIFHGEQDNVVPLAATVEFVDLVNAGRYDGLAELIVLEGEGHGIKTPAYQRLEVELSEEALEKWMADAKLASAARVAAAERAAEARRLEVARLYGASGSTLASENHIDDDSPPEPGNETLPEATRQRPDGQTEESARVSVDADPGDIDSGDIDSGDVAIESDVDSASRREDGSAATGPDASESDASPPPTDHPESPSEAEQLFEQEFEAEMETIEVDAHREVGATNDGSGPADNGSGGLSATTPVTRADAQSGSGDPGDSARDSEHSKPVPEPGTDPDPDTDAPEDRGTAREVAAHAENEPVGQNDAAGADVETVGELFDQLGFEFATTPADDRASAAAPEPDQDGDGLDMSTDDGQESIEQDDWLVGPAPLASDGEAQFESLAQRGAGGRRGRSRVEAALDLRSDPKTGGDTDPGSSR